jgi:hypothetical protein
MVVLALDPIIPGDWCAGNMFHQPVRTLVDETILLVSEPPGNPAGFQARADLPTALKIRLWIFKARFLPDTEASIR